MEIYKEDIGFTGTKTQLKKKINQYKKDIDTWANGEGIPKPVPDHPVYDALLEADDFTLKSREKEEADKLKKEEADRLKQEAEEQARQEQAAIDHTNKCTPDHADYDYAYARQNGETKYDPTAEQLDQLYHDIDQGLISAKAKTSAFYLNRKQVKEAYPKQDT